MEPTPTGPTATEPDVPGLAELIGAEAVPGFLRAQLGRQPFRTRLARPAQRLFGWPQLNALLREHRLSPPRLRLERAGADVTQTAFRSRRTRRGTVMRDLDVAALNAILRDGATLIIDAVNEASAPLDTLCAGLASGFLASCQANLYACWGQTRGFDVHWDDHDVFVVQVEGRKRWTLYGANLAHPTRAAPALDHPRPEQPLDEFVLEPGEVLYLPRGHWHAAVGVGEPSLHLTIGLTRRNGGDFLRWLADQALSDALVRADLPLEAGDEALAARIQALLARSSSDAPVELARRYRRHLAAGQVYRPRLSLPHIGEPAGVDTGATIRLTPGAAGLRTEGDEAVLDWRGVEFRIDGGLEAPLRRLVAGEAVACTDLGAGLRPGQQTQVQDFVAQMIGRGVFAVEPGAP